MGLQETRDHAVITARLDELIAADPVRNTVLGSVRADLADPWAVLGADCIAARSGVRYPVALSTGWEPAGLAELAPLVDVLPKLQLSGSLDVIERLAARLSRTVVERRAMRLFRLDDLRPPPDVPGRAERADDGQRALLTAWVHAFAAETGIPDIDSGPYVERALSHAGVWLWLDAAGTVVSTAFRRPVEFGSARIGPVYTPPEQRGHGFGSAVTAAATQDVLDDGAVPVLFTDLANPTSNKIYAALGYAAVDDRVHLHFAD